MTAAELAESIHWEAEQYIPFDIDDVNLDYQILEGSSLSGEGNMDVLLAAAKKDKINDYTSVITQAGLQPVAVDIAAFALAERLRGELRIRAAPDHRARRRRSRRQLHHGAARRNVGATGATSTWAAISTPTRSRRSSTSPRSRPKS